MRRPDDCTLTPGQLAIIKREAERALREAGALGVFPTPVERIMSVAKVEEVKEDLLSPGLLAKIRAGAEMAGGLPCAHQRAGGVRTRSISERGPMKTKSAAALFASFKTSRAVPSSRPHRRDLLIQSTLDAGVRAIEYHPMVVLDDHVIRTDAIVLDRDDGRYVIDFVDARPLEDPRAEGLLQIGFEQRCSGIVAVSAADVGRESRRRHAIGLWKYKVAQQRGR